MSGLENLDFFTDKSLVDDPYDYYDAIRRRPIWREPAHGVVMVSGYDEAIAVQRDPDQTFSVCNIVSGPWSGIPSETDRDDVSDLIERHRHRVTFGDYFITFDPPKHTAHRSLLNRLFTPRQLKNSDDFLWHLADEQLDRFIAEGKCEIVIDYNFPFTLDAITDLLDVPEADRERFRRAATPSRLEGERSGFVGVKEEWFIEQKIHTNADNYKLPQEFRDWQACAKDRDATIYKLSAAVVNLCQMVEYLGIGAATRRR